MLAESKKKSIYHIFLLEKKILRKIKLIDLSLRCTTSRKAQACFLQSWRSSSRLSGPRGAPSRQGTPFWQQSVPRSVCALCVFKLAVILILRLEYIGSVEEKWNLIVSLLFIVKPSKTTSFHQERQFLRHLLP